MAKKQMSKHDLYKIIAAAAVAVVGYGAIALTNTPDAEPVPEPSGNYTAGTYTASAQGIFSEVTVEMTFSDTAMSKATIDVSGETPEIGGAIGGDMADKLFEAQSADIDGVSGATMTSNAIKEAAAQCFAQALGGEAAAPAEEAAEAEEAEAEVMAAEEAVTGRRAGVDYVIVDAPEADLENGVVSAEAWKEIFPEIYDSYNMTSENEYTISYIADDEDPYLVDIYEGYGFAKDYNSARGHAYCLEDVQGTARPHALANCLTCKTSDYTALVNALGTDAYSMAFEDVVGDMTENVGCYNCHANNAGNAGELTVTHDYTVNGLGDEGIDNAILTCGQCHIEYYFDSETKATSIPYDSVEAMDPEAILAYYNEIGFSDWTQESTGTGMLKAQHPEMETFLGEGGKHAAFGLTCADCHMAVETADDGSTYVSHNLVSPLESDAILETCTQCHGDTDMAEKVHSIQDEITARETATGNSLSYLKTQLAAAVASGDYTEEELDEIRDLYRSAQWFFDFDYVENSEGAHNSTLANRCLDLADGYIEQAAALFK